MSNNQLFFKANSIYMVIGVLLLAGVTISSLGIFLFYQFQSARLQESTLQAQREKTHKIADGIEDYLRITLQLSRSITSLVAPVRQDKNTIETLLRRMLHSAPEEMVYGIGVWYEPQVFDEKTPFFGPYVHRASSPDAAPVLTYEWCMPEYNFPQQPWYLAGKHARGKTVFTEPYFDTDLIYMTASRAFYDKDQNFIGVTSVDMVLPLLQKFVAQYNTSQEESVYIITEQGHIFIHPKEAELLDYVRSQGLQPNSILDVQEKDLQAFQRSQQLTDQVRVSAAVADVNWRIYITADRNKIFSRINDLKNNLLWATALIWLLFLFLFALLIQAHKARVKHNKLKERLHEQAQKQQLLQQINDALEVKVKERTLELEAANQKISNLNQQLQAENLRMGAELDVTRRLQQMVLPRPEELTRIPGLDIAGFMQPATEVGGDYYDVLLHQDHVKIGIGDVTGHGLESGVVMLMVQMAVRTLLAHDVSNPKVFLQTLNRALYDNVQRMHSDKNLTLALLDYHQGQLTVSGQHEELLIVRKNAHIERLDTLHLGFMVGLIDDISNMLGLAHISLDSGDGIVLYTDGVTEARNAEEEIYGVQRLIDSIAWHWDKSCAADVCQAIIKDLNSYIGDAQVRDDITLLVLRRE